MKGNPGSVLVLWQRRRQEKQPEEWRAKVKISAYKYVQRSEMANKVVGVCKYSLFGKLINYFRTFLMNV